MNNPGSGLEKSQFLIAVKTFNPYAVGSKTKPETLVFKPNIKVFAVDLRRLILAHDYPVKTVLINARIFSAKALKCLASAAVGRPFGNRPSSPG